LALRSYFLTHARELKLTNPDQVQEAIRVLKFSKSPDPDGITKKALKHLPSELLPSWPRFSKRFSSSITSLQCKSTLD
jgi:hypothetical protein